jgi:uncharacterized membrane protein
MKVQKSIFSLFAFLTLAVFLITLASASFSFINPTGATQSVISSSTSTTATITFDINASGHGGTLHNATLVLPNLFGVNTQWSGDTGNFTFYPNTQVSKTVTVTIPANQASGDYTGLINISGNYLTISNVTGTSITTNPLNVNIQVTNPSQILTIQVPSNPVKLGQNTTITLTNSGSATLSNIILSEVTSSLFGATFNPTTIVNLANGATSLPINVILISLQNIKFGLNDILIKATSGNIEATNTIKVKKTFCDFGEKIGNLTLSNVDWNNNGEGTDNSWELLDEIEVEVEGRNNNQDDDVDVVFELGLFDKNGKNVGDDLEYLIDSDSNDQEISSNINDDDEETVFFRFKVPGDFDDGEYKLALKVYDDDDGEDFQCADSSSDLSDSFYQKINIDRVTEDDREVVVDNIIFDSQASCGETVTGQFTVYNIGTDDQDRVKITMKNNDLGINQEFEVTNLDPGDNKKFDFTINIPKGASDGSKKIDFKTFYKYKNGVFKEESDKTFNGFVEVLGCSLTNLGGPSTSAAIITASLQSEAIAGKDLVISSTITNIGTEALTYIISTRGYSTWSTLKEISKPSLTLQPGETGDVEFTFKVNDDATGSQTFTIQTAAGTKIDTQDVEINIKGKNNGFNFNFGDNNLIWIIAIVNVVLILLIVIVAVRLSRR